MGNPFLRREPRDVDENHLVATNLGQNLWRGVACYAPTNAYFVFTGPLKRKPVKQPSRINLFSIINQPDLPDLGSPFELEHEIT